jgi:hypothetical protein
VADWQHYRIWYEHWEGPHRLEKENVIVYEGRHCYEIEQRYNLKLPVPFETTELRIYEVDAENRIIDTKKVGLFTYNKKLFDFSQTNREKIINRVKTILVFQ